MVQKWAVEELSFPTLLEEAISRAVDVPTSAYIARGRFYGLLLCNCVIEGETRKSAHFVNAPPFSPPYSNSESSLLALKGQTVAVCECDVGSFLQNCKEECIHTYSTYVQCIRTYVSMYEYAAHPFEAV